ncbi:MAG: aldo/keto reductase, partial [Bacteroidales bacterium]
MKNQSKILRRHFIKLLGGATAISFLPGCKPQKRRGGVSANVPADAMTYRTSASSADRVSLLGYGCMRWPLLPAPASDGNVADQEAVNELIDYALAHGVNYFDTAPVYTQGWSERTTGTALSRHPRQSYYIATKLSNFSPATWSREESLKIYNNSFEYLRTDYIDYMLLHAVGQGGMENLHKRYLDNGILDFLIEERKRGKIRNLGFSYHGDVSVFDYLLSKQAEYQWDFVQIQLNYVDWRHAGEQNTNAEYLLGELRKRNIPAVIMEPLLGGRLAKLPDYLATRLKEQEPGRSVASWAFRYAGSYPEVLCVLSGMTYMEHLQDNIRTY